MVEYNKIINKLDRFGSMFYFPVTTFVIFLLFRNFINDLIFPSVPRSGLLFVFQGWINTGYGAIFVGFFGFIVLLSTKISKDYFFSPPYNALRTHKIENISKDNVSKVQNRSIYPMFIALVGSFIPPVFGNWALFPGGYLSVNRSDIVAASIESESLLSAVPVIGEYSLVDVFLMVPNPEGKILMMILSGLMLISLWNLSYLSQIYFHG